MRQQILLVRSPESVVKEGFVGVGWSSVDFSQHEKAEDILQILKEQGKNIGRRSNIIRFFVGLKQGDIVIVPLYRSIAIGIVSGKKRYSADAVKDDACNQISVEYLKTKEGKPLYISRKELSQGLESRLKIRMTIAKLEKFKEEILKIMAMAKENGAYQASSYILEKENIARENFRSSLLSAILHGHTKLDAGGYGLEKLVKELLEIEGYKASIQAKNQSSDISDIDIFAEKEDKFYYSRLLIQVKHHKGLTNEHGLKQLIAYETEDDVQAQKWLITSANMSNESIELARENNIQMMNGEELVDWIADCLPKLSTSTKQTLGIIEVPQVICLDS